MLDIIVFFQQHNVFIVDIDLAAVLDKLDGEPPVKACKDSAPAKAELREDRDLLAALLCAPDGLLEQDLTSQIAGVQR